MKKQALENAKKVLSSFKNRGGLNNFAFLDKNGNKIRQWTVQPCYMSLMYDPPLNDKFHYFADRSKRPAFYNKEIKNYINFVINFSAWAPAHVLKNPKEVFEYGCILDASKFDARYIVSATMLIRYLWEHPRLVENWNIFKDYINPDAAIALIHLIRTDNSKNNIQEYRMGGGHEILDGTSVTPSLVWNIMKGNFYQERSVMSKNTNYSNLPVLWEQVPNKFSRSKFDLVPLIRGKKEVLENTLGLKFKMNTNDKLSLGEKLKLLMNNSFGEDYVQEGFHRRPWC